MILLVVLGFAALALIDVPWLIKKKYKWELTVYFILMVLAFTLIVLQLMDIDIPNPVKETQYAVKWIFKQLHLTYD